MVEQFQQKLSHHRRRIIPGLLVLSLLSGVIVSVLSTPNAQADYYLGCGYGYNSSGGGFGYGTGIGHAYGYGDNHDGVFQFGYGYQVCPDATTTTTTTGGGGGGGGTTTTTTATGATTTTTATGATTTTTVKTGPPQRKRLFAHKVHGYARVGRTVRLAITGGGFYGQPKITSSEGGTKVGVQHDYGNLIIVRVTTHARSKGWHTFTIRDADGRICRVNYLVK